MKPDQGKPTKDGDRKLEVFRVSEEHAGWKVERVATGKETLFRRQEAAEQYANQAARFKAPSEVVLLRLDGALRHLSRYHA